MWHIECGEYEIRKITRLDVYSGRNNPIDTAEIELGEDIPLDSFYKGMSVNIDMGYAEHGTWLVFAGSIKDVRHDKAPVLLCQDSMGTLAEVNQTFTNVVPQEIFRYMLRKSGVADGDIILSQKPMPTHKTFMARGLAHEVFRSVNEAWNLDWSFYFEPDGRFYWGPWEESDRYKNSSTVAFEHGVSIINHRVTDEDHGVIETFLIPFIRHSNIIKIVDERYWAEEITARVERAQYHWDEAKARMWIEWSRVMS